MVCDGVRKQALKALREAADKVQKQPVGTPPSTVDTGVPATATSEDKEQSQVMLALGALLSREPTAAVQVRFP